MQCINEYSRAINNGWINLGCIALAARTILKESRNSQEFLLCQAVRMHASQVVNLLEYGQRLLLILCLILLCSQRALVSFIDTQRGSSTWMFVLIIALSGRCSKDLLSRLRFLQSIRESGQHLLYTLTISLDVQINSHLLIQRSSLGLNPF